MLVPVNTLLHQWLPHWNLPVILGGPGLDSTSPAKGNSVRGNSANSMSAAQHPTDRTFSTVTLFLPLRQVAERHWRALYAPIVPLHCIRSIIFRSQQSQLKGSKSQKLGQKQTNSWVRRSYALYPMYKGVVELQSIHYCR